MIITTLLILAMAFVVWRMVRRVRRGTPPTVMVGPVPGRIKGPRGGERL